MSKSGVVQNTMLRSVQTEIASSKTHQRTRDSYCKILQQFYEDTKEDREALRLSPNNIMAGAQEGEDATAQFDSKAMKNTKKKRLMANTIDEKQEEKVNEDTASQLKKAHCPQLKILSHQLPKTDVVDRGISLKGLRTILEEYRKNIYSFQAYRDSHREKGDTKPNGDFLVWMLVKPETRTFNCSYIEHLNRILSRSLHNPKHDEWVNFIKTEKDEILGKVNVFVSHAWAYDFQTLVESVEQWEKNWEKVNGSRHETFYYFIDYFAVNQHNQKDDLSKLQEVIRVSKVTCLLLNPWYNPIPLRRLWCIWEIAKTGEYPSTRLNVAFTPEQVKRFKENFFGDSEKVRLISRMLEIVDSKNAKATRKEDEIKIKYDIEKMGGFQKVNVRCIRTLRKWLIDQACEFADEEARGEHYKKSNDKVAIEKAYSVLKNVGTFLRHQGKFEKSIKYLKEGIRMMEEYYGESVDEKDDEKVYCKDWLELSYNKIRKKHKKKFLELLNSLANSLTEVQQYSEAEAIYRKTLDWRVELLGWNVKPTRITQFNLGVCLIHREQLKEAEKILQEVINFWSKNEKYHYWALFNLADLKSRDFLPKDATKYFEVACNGLRDVCEVKRRDRFLSLAEVLWAKHILRSTPEVRGKHEEKLLETALIKAQTACDNFRINSDPTHPDARLAARTKRRIELRLYPEMLKEKKEQRDKLMEETYERKWSSSPIERGNQKKNIIRVMHWNLLADKLAYPDFKKGGFGCDFDLLNWNKWRKERVLAEIIKYDPDVLVLVELDHYEDIRFVLQEDFGYRSIWKKKNSNFYTDGTGIFWKRNRFKSGIVYKKPLMKSLGKCKEADQVFVAVELESLPDQEDNFGNFVVGGCHLKSTKKSIGEQIRLDQCEQVMRILKQEFSGLPIVIGSDLNAEATAADYEALAYPYFVKSGMVSAYQNVLKREPPYTSWKFRIDEGSHVSEAKKVKEWKYTIDFIFHSEELKSLNILQVPDEKDIDNAYGEKPEDGEDVIAFARRRRLLPNERCSSDHLPILAEILLPPGKNNRE